MQINFLWAIELDFQKNQIPNFGIYKNIHVYAGQLPDRCHRVYTAVESEAVHPSPWWDHTTSLHGDHGPRGARARHLCFHDHTRVSMGTEVGSTPWQQGLWGQHGAHLGPTGPRWAPGGPHEPCYLGYSSVHYVFCYQYFWFNKMMCLNFQIIFMFEQCLCSITVVTPVKYESDIQYVNSAFMTLKNGFE